MSHVDDGQLHAYLDGAFPPGDPERTALEDHLATCADCRGRLEAERLERDEAAGILGLLEPEHIRTPPFETLLAMRPQGEGTAGGRPASGQAGAGPGSPSRPRRLVPLAWAASLAAAIGGGWMAHGVWSGAAGDLRPGAAMESSADVGVGADESAGARTEVAEAMPQSGAAPPARSTPPADAALPPGAPPPAGLNRAAAADQVATAEAEAADLAASEAQARAVADSLRTVVAALQAAVDTLRSAGMSVARLTPPGQQTTGTVGGAAAALAGKVAADAAAADALAAREPPGAPQAEPTAEELAAIAELESIGRVLGAREASADLTGAWQPVTPAEAAEALGRMPFDLDELPWDQMELARVEGQALLRTRHPLPEGTPLVIVQVAWPGVGDLLIQERAAVAGRVQGQGIRIPFTMQRAMEAGARPRALAVTLPLRDGAQGVALVLGPGTDGPLSRMAVWIESQGAALLLRGPDGPGGPGGPELAAVLRRLR